MKSFLRVIKWKIVLPITDFFYRIFHKPPNIMSFDETLDMIIGERKSIGRYGDGEFLITVKKNIPFQKHNIKLTERLREILKNDNEGFVVGISNMFKKDSNYDEKNNHFNKLFRLNNRRKIYKYLNFNSVYGNSYITRPYMMWNDKATAGERFEKLRRVWENRDVVLIEGEESRLGVGNDFLVNAKSIQRILCPKTDAFDKYDEILSEAKKLPKDKLVMIALGPAATVLAYDLHKEGYQAFDLGHADIEYEWWKMGAKEKAKVVGKYVNEVSDGKLVENAIVGDDYITQTIAHIL